MTEKELKQSVKCPSGGYFFCGEEDYLKEYYSSVIRSAVITDESIAVFNEVIFDDDSFGAQSLSSALASPPLMSEKKLLKVRLSSYQSLSDKEKRELYDIYASLTDYPDTVLIISVAPDGFDPGSEKRPSAAFKAISKNLNAVSFPLQSEAKLIQWLSRRFATNKLSAQQDVLRQMILLCGRSMHRLRGEADKLIAAASSMNASEITNEILRAVVSQTPEEDAFMLANSVLSGNRQNALECLLRAKRRGENPVKLLASVSASFCDMAVVAQLSAENNDKRAIAAALGMHEYRVGLYMRAVSGIPHEVLADAVAKCAEAELKMKTSPLGYIPLERLICTATPGRKHGG